MHARLNALLREMRARRRFDVELYVEAKTRLLDEYFKRSGLRAAILGVSGGIDSAVTLGLLRAAAARPGSPIERIVGALMPMHIRAGTTGQDDATARGRETLAFFGGDVATIDLSRGHDVMKETLDAALDVPGDAWAAGQLVSNLRTPALYYAASLMTQRGLPTIVVGTTNRDEGGYIGYFGKAADGLNDVQLISDLHKSEVYQLARHLGVPRSVIDAVPTGDIYDGRNDEQLIGTTYDAIELYTHLKVADDARVAAWTASLCDDARAELAAIAARLDTLNKQCAHKYIGGTTSTHLDVYPRAVPGGWRDDVEVAEVDRYLAGAGHFNAPFALAPGSLRPRASAESRRVEIDGPAATLVERLLSPGECDTLVAQLNAQAWRDVGVDGRATNFTAGVSAVGSARATAYDPAFARELWERLAPHLPPVRLFERDGHADVGDDFVWRPVGVSPALRFIRYRENGHLIPHYDAPFEYWEGRRTLVSVIVYVQTTATGGRTRLIVDPQAARPFAARDFSDWTRVADAADVRVAVSAARGSALLFDHRVLHDAEALTAGEKIVLRTDVIFERGGPRRKNPVHPSLALGFPTTKETLDARTAAKVNEDPFYAEVWARSKSRARLKQAGFLDDGTAPGRSLAHDPNFLTTPFDKILDRLDPDDARPPVVLVSTGGFSPIHQGHLAMMELAKAELEREGAAVLGGYLSPSHDAYVSTKAADVLDAPHRLHLCEEAVADSAWLMVDPWESLHRAVPVNFTAVVHHLGEYLARHIATSTPIRIVYVYGGDNAGFGYAFLDRGDAVCVRRPGWDETFDAVARDSDIAACHRVRMVHTPAADVSSKAIRGGDTSALTARVREVVADWRGDRTVTPARYCVRDEGEAAIWPEAGPHYAAFRENLTNEIARAFALAEGPSRRYDVTFDVTTLREQLPTALAVAREHRVISMDPFFAGTYDLAVSRRFALSSGSHAATIVARPGAAALAEQIAAIAPGDYVLLDDDIATGTTMDRVTALLPAPVRITKRQALTTACLGGRRKKLDILDLRDFLCGTREGGLVVRLPNGELARAPYALPYVSPAARANTPIGQNVALSLAIWRLNRDFFAALPRRLTLGQVDLGFRRLMHYVGFDDATPLELICAWHVARLRENFPEFKENSSSVESRGAELHP